MLKVLSKCSLKNRAFEGVLGTGPNELRALTVVVDVKYWFRDNILAAQPLAEINQLATLRTKWMVPTVLGRDMVFLANRTGSFSFFFGIYQDPLPPLPSTTLNRFRLRSTRRRKRHRWNLSFH